MAEKLSRREDQVWAYVAYGLTNQEIAEEIGRTTRTVEAHVISIMNKKGFKHRTEAAVAWYKVDREKALQAARALA